MALAFLIIALEIGIGIGVFLSLLFAVRYIKRNYLTRS